MGISCRKHKPRAARCAPTPSNTHRDGAVVARDEGLYELSQVGSVLVFDVVEARIQVTVVERTRRDLHGLLERLLCRTGWLGHGNGVVSVGLPHARSASRRRHLPSSSSFRELVSAANDAIVLGMQQAAWAQQVYRGSDSVVVGCCPGPVASQSQSSSRSNFEKV